MDLQIDHGKLAGAWLEDEGDMQTVLTYVTEHLTPKFPGDMSADEQAKRTPKYIWKVGD